MVANLAKTSYYPVNTRSRQKAAANTRDLAVSHSLEQQLWFKDTPFRRDGVGVLHELHSTRQMVLCR